MYEACYEIVLCWQLLPSVAHFLTAKMNWVLLIGYLQPGNWNKGKDQALGHCLAASEHACSKQKEMV